LRIRMRKRVKLPLLPVSLNFTQRGLSSIGVRILGWSWNSRRPGRSRVDLPGPFHAELGDAPGDRSPGNRRSYGRGVLAVPVVAIAVIGIGAALGLWAVSGAVGAIEHAVAAAVSFTARIL
jgi:hypothetical protein